MLVYKLPVGVLILYGVVMEHARVDLDSSARPMIHVFNCLLTLQVILHKPGEERVTESEENELP